MADTATQRPRPASGASRAKRCGKTGPGARTAPRLARARIPQHPRAENGVPSSPGDLDRGPPPRRRAERVDAPAPAPDARRPTASPASPRSSTSSAPTAWRTSRTSSPSASLRWPRARARVRRLRAAGRTVPRVDAQDVPARLARGGHQEGQGPEQDARSARDRARVQRAVEDGKRRRRRRRQRRRRRPNDPVEAEDVFFPDDDDDVENEDPAFPDDDDEEEWNDARDGNGADEDGPTKTSTAAAGRRRREDGTSPPAAKSPAAAAKSRAKSPAEEADDASRLTDAARRARPSTRRARGGAGRQLRRVVRGRRRLRDRGRARRPGAARAGPGERGKARKKVKAPKRKRKVQHEARDDEAAEEIWDLRRRSPEAGRVAPASRPRARGAEEARRSPRRSERRGRRLGIRTRAGAPARRASTQTQSRRRAQRQRRRRRRAVARRDGGRRARAGTSRGCARPSFLCSTKTASGRRRERRSREARRSALDDTRVRSGLRVGDSSETRFYSPRSSLRRAALRQSFRRLDVRRRHAALSTFTVSPWISSTSGSAPTTPKDIPTSTRQMRPSHSPLHPPSWGVCPTTILGARQRVQGLAQHVARAVAVGLRHEVLPCRTCGSTPPSPSPPDGHPSAARSSSSAISMPRIQSATDRFSFSRPNSTCRGIRPPCANTVSFTMSTVLFMASCCASGPPGENRPTRALTCFLRGSFSAPPKGVGERRAEQVHQVLAEPHGLLERALRDVPEIPRDVQNLVVPVQDVHGAALLLRLLVKFLQQDQDGDLVVSAIEHVPDLHHRRVPPDPLGVHRVAALAEHARDGERAAAWPMSPCTSPSATTRPGAVTRRGDTARPRGRRRRPARPPRAGGGAARQRRVEPRAGETHAGMRGELRAAQRRRRERSTALRAPSSRVWTARARARAREDKIDVGVDATDRLGSAGRCALDSVARVERLRNVRCDSRDSSLRTTAPRGVTSRRDFEHPKDAASGPGVAQVVHDKPGR